MSGVLSSQAENLAHSAGEEASRGDPCKTTAYPPLLKSTISFDGENEIEYCREIENRLELKEKSAGSSSFQKSSSPLMETEDDVAELKPGAFQNSTKNFIRKISEHALAVSEGGVVDFVSTPGQEENSRESTPTIYSSPDAVTHPPKYTTWNSTEESSSRVEHSWAQRSQSMIGRRSKESQPSKTTEDLMGSFTHEAYLVSKHLQTNHLMTLHSLKAKLSKYQSYVERAFTLVNIGTEDAIIEGFGIIAKVMTKSWAVPKIGHDLAYGLCDFMRDTGTLMKVVDCFVHPDTPSGVRLAAGQALEESCSARNRDYLVKASCLKPIVRTAKAFASEGCEDWNVGAERLRVSISLMESLFKHSPETCLELIDISALDHILSAIKSSKSSQTLRHCALAMANLSMYSDTECHQKMTGRKVQDWLFLLAALQDDITRYYACLAICMLVSNKEIETAVIKSGTLSLVEPFLLAHKPEDFAKSDFKHSQGRPKEWLQKLVPMLSANRCEARSLAAFHFAMEAGIKKEQAKLDAFEAIGAIQVLKVVASRPDGAGPKFARMALKIIGEEMPYKLSQQVPLWSVDDVEYWVKHIGFESFSSKFKDQMVDGDILLLLTNTELERDIQMSSGLLRRRFMRELDSLKISADYSCVDESHLDQFLMSLNPYFSVYTYQMLELGMDTSSLHSLTDDVLRDCTQISNQCRVLNPVHRRRLLQAFQDIGHMEDMEIAILSRHIDIFISYRRNNGSQLASLIKVLLQLRGHKVFIDVDRLYAGKFDASLFKNIQAAKHFILVLTPKALDRTIRDTDCEDWVHKEVLCAIEANRNIIPIFDPGFDWPDEQEIPPDIRAITKFNGVRWVHEYQEACVDKVEKFVKGEINKSTIIGGYPGTRSPPAASPAHFRSTNGHQIWKPRNKPVI